MNQTQQYDDIATEYAAIRNATKQYVLHPTLLAMAGDLSGRTILDVGCGDGYFTRLFAHEHPASIMGVDISTEMIALAKQNKDPIMPTIEYMVGDIAMMELSQRFDVITAVYVLNYATTPEKLLQMSKNLFTHLNNGGRLCIITLTPKLQPRTVFLRDWRFLHSAGQSIFHNGDEVISEVKNPETGTVSSFTCHYWDEATYTNALKAAGFASVEWIYDMTISAEGMKCFGEAFWDEWKQTKAAVAVLCVKE